ncbi:polysaccharide deacetylase family protein [Devriesea agamarum]|uniref:polysaccharide deacetylase family protein n=1 Tax=Devriesea agamarum TaxID=472569 RepID=UPI0018D2AC9C|nr:polysaccharide deacetylase family protein [Devriesea agamarum]
MPSDRLVAGVSNGPASGRGGARTRPGRRSLVTAGIGVGACALGAGSTAVAGEQWMRRELRRNAAPPRDERTADEIAPAVLFRRQVAERVIALTFDDGPDPRWTPQVLDFLGRHGARATFFELGEFAAKHPDLTREVIAHGHEVALHGYDHTNLGPEPLEVVTDQVRRGLDALRAAGAGPVLWRPPYGGLSAPVLFTAARAGLDLVLWSHHVTGAEPGWCREQVQRLATPGSIVLAHDGRGDPTDALMRELDRLVAEMTADGWRFVTVSELHSLPGQ